MGRPVLTAADIPTKLPETKNGAVVQANLAVDGISWKVTCVSMGNPHCVTFGNERSEVMSKLNLDNLTLITSPK